MKNEQIQHWLHQLRVAIAQLVNVFCGGLADETLSARAHRMREKGHKWWGWAADFIDKLFFWEQGHCAQSYQSEIERKQMPSHYQQLFENGQKPTHER